MIPESPEVINQTAKRLRRLAQRSNSGEDIQDVLNEELTPLTADGYIRAFRVAEVISNNIVTAVRRKLKNNGADQNSGVDFSFTNEPEPFEVAYVAYVNQMVKGEREQARETFSQMVASEPEKDIQTFVWMLFNFFEQIS
jgi:hypothetical protein